MAITSRDVGISIFTGLLITFVSLAITAAAKAGREQSSARATDAYRYENLPEVCVCHTPGCEYRIEQPGVHCSELTCPKCGQRLWRGK